VTGFRCAPVPLRRPGDGDVGFRIEREDGAELDVACSVPEIGDIFSFLGTLAKHAGEETQASLQDNPQQSYLVPIPATEIGFASSASPNETLLVIGLHGFGLAFSIPNSGLERMADELARTARTLSADQTRKN
jgi:hypothetical protein